MQDEFNKGEMERLKKLLQALDAPDKKGSKDVDLENWWDDTDVKNFLRISQRTLERRRADETILFHKVGGRCYYIPKNIFDLRYKYMK